MAQVASRRAREKVLRVREESFSFQPRDQEGRPGTSRPSRFESKIQALQQQRTTRLAPLLFSLCVLVVAAGCSSSDDGPGPQAVSGATILKFQAQPSSIFPGETTTLSWDVRDAATVRLADGEGNPVDLDAAALEARSLTVSPAATTRYVLEAVGRDRRAVSRTANVTVRPAKPTILSFTASPDSIEVGDGLTLSWATEGADAVRLLAKGGASVDIQGASPADGSVSVKPTASTSYTLEATNVSGKVEAAVQIQVTNSLDLEFYAHEERIRFGESTLLDWRTRSAERVVLSTGGEILVDSTTSPSGKFEVQPTRNTTYRFVAHGRSGSKELSAEVKVEAAIESFAADASGPVARGTLVGLSWSTGGADSLRLTTSDGFLREIDAAERDEGSTTLPVPNDGRFVLSATTVDGLETVGEIVLALLDGPEVLELTVSPSSLTLEPGSTAEVVLSWTTRLASSVDLVRQGAGVIYADDAEGQQGSTTALVDRSSTFILSARNAAGVATRQVEVAVVLPPTIDRFVAQPAHVGVGEILELVWNAPNATSVELFQGPSRIHASSTTQGSFPYQVASDSTFRLVAVNSLGQSAEETLVVTVGAPQILDFTASPDHVGPGGQISFQWTNRGGSSLQVLGPNGPIPACSTSLADTIASGTCSTPAPATLGSVDYQLILTNGISQTATATRSVTVADGPSILNFGVDRSLITRNETVTFFWQTRADADGTTPQLSLVDGADTYSLDGADALDGSITVEPRQVGARTFRLTASTPGTASASWDLGITVYEAPTLSVSSSPDTYFPGEGPVSLSWQSTHAIGISVQELNEEEEAQELAFFADPALVAAGTFGVLPPSPGRTYRIVATNAAGSSVSQEIHVSWNQPEIVDFSAAPANILIGDTAFLQWITNRTDEVEIAPRPVVRSAPFVDVSTSPTATAVELGACDAPVITDGCAPITLPSSFPFGGVARTSALVFLNGVISFDTEFPGTSSTNERLPSSSASFVSLAPFWQGLRASVPDGGRSGKIFVDRGSDDGGVFTVVQWKGFWVDGATAADPVDLNFEVILYESGNFDFRYDTMLGGSLAERANGERASIGYQIQAGEGQSVAFREVVAVGLQGRSLGFRLGAFPVNGTLEIFPLADGLNSYTLTATSTAGTASASASVRTNDSVTLGSLASSMEYPAPGERFELSWDAPGAVEVRVERPLVDEEDEEEEPEVLCTFVGGGPGSCELQEATQGVYRYVVRAVGAGFGDEALDEIELRIFPAFSIDTLTAIGFVEPAEDEEDEDVEWTRVSWTTTNVQSLVLREDGVVVNTSGVGVGSGSLDLPYDPAATYTLTVTSQGRVRSQTTTVVEIEIPDDPED